MLEDQCFDEAELSIRLEQSNEPRLGRVHSFQLARLLEQRGRLEAAIDADRKAIECRPQLVPAIASSAALQNRLGMPAEAETAYRRAIELQPDSAELHTSLGKMLANGGRHEEAITQFDRALQQEPAHAPTHVSRALSLLHLGGLADGWEEYGWRLQVNESTGQVFPFAATSVGWVTIGWPHHFDFWRARHCRANHVRDLLSRRHPKGGEVRDRVPVNFERVLRRSFPEATMFGVPLGSQHRWRLPPEIKIDVKCAAGSLPRHLRQRRKRSKTVTTADRRYGENRRVARAAGSDRRGQKNRHRLATRT